jgi:hypothetical protein
MRANRRRLLQQLAFSKSRHFSWDNFPANSMAYDIFRLIYIVVKPNVVVDVEDLQNKMEKMTLITCDNNFHSLAMSLEEFQQEINAKKGKDFLKDDKLLTKLLRAAKTTTNKLFAINLSLAKTPWITGKLWTKTVSSRIFASSTATVWQMAAGVGLAQLTQRS